MTRKDFEVIARAFSYCESHLFQDMTGGETTQDERETLAWIVEKMGEHLATTNPRFDQDRFERASLPLRRL